MTATELAPPRQAARGPRAGGSDWLLRWLWLLPALAAWSAYASASRLFPSPQATLTTAWELLGGGQLAGAALASLARVAVGLGLVCATAIPLGVGLGLSARARGASAALVALLRPLPPIAWLPLLVLLWGLQERTAVALIWVGAFFPLLITTADAVSGVERLYLDAARVLGAGRWQRVWHVVLPAALPGVLAGVRYSLGLGWMLVVVSELVAARSGLGSMIQLAKLDMRLDVILVGIAAIGLLGSLLDTAFQVVARRLSPLARIQAERRVPGWR